VEAVSEMMEAVAAFVQARTEEAAAAANAMEHVTAESEAHACPATRTGPLGDLEWGEDACWCGLAERKTRALREVEARHRIVLRCAARMDELDALPNGLVSARAVLARQVLLDLAAIDAGHPDYDKEAWKP
jgi:hypothetical protein